MNQCKYVFNQLTDFLPQRVPGCLVGKWDGNKYVRFFSCWNQLSCMLFGQLSGRENLRDLVIGLEAQKSRFYYLDFGKNYYKRASYKTRLPGCQRINCIQLKLNYI